jgi:hypothetical protein
LIDDLDSLRATWERADEIFIHLVEAVTTFRQRRSCGILMDVENESSLLMIAREYLSWLPSKYGQRPTHPSVLGPLVNGYRAIIRKTTVLYQRETAIKAAVAGLLRSSETVQNFSPKIARSVCEPSWPSTSVERESVVDYRQGSTGKQVSYLMRSLFFNALLC